MTTMDRLALIGVSYRRGGAAALESWQGHLQEKTHQDVLALGFEEVVMLQTCNRCDLLVTLDPSMSVEEARSLLAPADWPRCYAYVGEGAVEQLARIASSLDSLNPGEYQIVTQVREAFAAAEAADSVGTHTRFALTTAFRIAKRIRSEIELAPLNTSLFSLARPELESHIPTRATIGIVGTGNIGQVAARVLQDRPETILVLVNRSQEKAELLATQLAQSQAEIKVISLEELMCSPPSLDALVCATSVSHLVDQALLSKFSGLRVIVDLGIPRNVDSEAAAAKGIAVLDVDTLQAAGDSRREKLEANLGQAEDLLLAELDDAIGEWLERQLGPSIKLLRERYVDTVADVCDTLDSKEQTRIASRMAHVPIKGLRALAREFGLDAARTFLEAAELTERSSPQAPD